MGCPVDKIIRQEQALQRPLRILWTLPYLPWPTTSGGKLRQFHLIRTLAERGHRITLLVQSKQALDADTQWRLSRLVERLIVLPRRPLKHPKTLLAAALAPYPLLASVNGLAPALSRRFGQLLAEGWDVVQIEHSYAAQPFLAELRRRRQAFLLTEHNVESALGAATYQHLPFWSKPYVVYDQWRYRRWEARVLKAAARVAAVTAEDAAQLARVRGDAVDVVVNGVDCRHFESVRPVAGSRRLLFVGNFEYPPNLDAVRWCVEDIMPRVWSQAADARLAICGYAMPEEWKTRWTDARIEWQGFVDDLRVEQAASTLFIAPLREGGGSKLKVLEAMAAGLPVVSTPQGVSGLSLRDGEDAFTAASAEGLAREALLLLASPRLAVRVGEAGRACARARHDWNAAADQLECLYREMLDARRS